MREKGETPQRTHAYSKFCIGIWQGRHLCNLINLQNHLDYLYLMFRPELPDDPAWSQALEKHSHTLKRLVWHYRCRIGPDLGSNERTFLDGEIEKYLNGFSASLEILGGKSLECLGLSGWSTEFVGFTFASSPSRVHN